MGRSQQCTWLSLALVHSSVAPQLEQTYRFPSWFAMLISVGAAGYSISRRPYHPWLP
jgi:hypothetical protein